MGTQRPLGEGSRAAREELQPPVLSPHQGLPLAVTSRRTKTTLGATRGAVDWRTTSLKPRLRRGG